MNKVGADVGRCCDRRSILTMHSDPDPALLKNAGSDTSCGGLDDVVLYHAHQPTLAHSCTPLYLQNRVRQYTCM